MKLQYKLGIALATVLVAGIWWITRHTGQVDFNSQVRPILNKRCVGCHGGVRQQSGLSLLFRDAALQPAESGLRAIVPGRPNASELISRITHEDPEMRMPPESEPLSTAEVSILRKWIKQGAEWADHWAYLKPDPNIAVPPAEGDWCRNEIDHFILQKIKGEGLQPSPRADKATLVRRVSMDLTGLPPESQLVTSFLNDDSPEAYEKLVDQLLASPHFGERWAAMWLDLARYADSQGYQKDHLRRDIWRYRDWVIHAFNQNMPFDQFTIDQLAGDLLDTPTEEQLLATAFHRNTMTNDEGGTDDEEFRVAAVIDRLNTTFDIWQGTTIACVQCHSHPYDPFDHREFYELYAFFNNTEDTDKTSDHPYLRLLSPEQKRKKQQLEEQLAAYESQNDTVSPDYKAELVRWQEVQPGKVPVMKELPVDSSRASFVFKRGNWLVHGEPVQPNVPKILNPLTDTLNANRLDLARWLVHPDNPLTARVIVNRFWEQVFGRGIVQTTEDFGTQGIKPTHQQLLDYLAVHFVHQDQWDVKALLKRMVLSATYQQSAEIDPVELEKDPYNKYLARGTRFRLSAEQIRDQALAVSGLLSRKMYGPSVMPPQPDGIWNVIRHIGRWETPDGEDRYRRGIYTFWRRVSPYPSMVTFDAPSREICVSRRIRTNTPLQALVTLNDPVYVEASLALAKRAYREADQDVIKAIAEAYRMATHRPPDEERSKALLDFYRQTLEKYRGDKEAYEQLLEGEEQPSAEMAALVNTTNVILNLDEMIMKS